MLIIRNIIMIVPIIVCLLSITSAGQDTVKLAKPYATKSVTNHPSVLGWIEGKTPIAPRGFKVTKFADGFENPRWIYQGPNGDLFIAESSTSANSANRITILQDKDQDGTFDTREVFLSNLNKPFGMLILNDYFYVANTDGLMRYPYENGQKSISATGKKILDLPAGGYNNHWTRNIIASPGGDKIYIAVGSGSNVGENGMENEIRRANILEINPDGTGEKIYASGLRNPVGMEFYPETTTLWTAVNERDGLGDNLVPDYLTSVKPNGFYGWPYFYWGQHPDPRLNGERSDSVQKAIVPDINLGSHTASLGMTFYDHDAFPEKYHHGAFVSQHGSWNRSEFSGYKVVFVPFDNEKPIGPTEDFLTGFIEDAKKGKVYGRPVGLMVLKDGSLLVADDAGNTIWQVKAEK